MNIHKYEVHKRNYTVASSIHVTAVLFVLKAKYRNMAKFLIMTLFSVDSNKTSLNELGWL